MRLRPVILDHRRRSVVLLGSAVLVMLLLAGGVVLTRDADNSPFRTVKPRGRAPAGTIVAVGDVLLGANSRSEPSSLLRSRDGGQTWAEASPPGMPKAADQYLSLSQHDDVVVLELSKQAEEPPLGTPPTYDDFVWTTTDGERWHGPLVLEATAGVGAPHVAWVDGRLVTGATLGAEFAIFISADQGVSWHRSEVAELSLIPEEVASLSEAWSPGDGVLHASVFFGGARDGRSALIALTDGDGWEMRDTCPTIPRPATGHCNPVLRTDNLLARGLETSQDGGATWVRAALDGEFDRAHTFGSIVDVPGGGWLATVNGHYYAGGGPLAWVVRSDDGVHWKPVLGPGADRCSPNAMETGASPLYRVGRRWYVSFYCPTRGFGLYVADEDGRPFRPLAKDAYVATPFRWKDTVGVPVFDRKDRLRLLFARP